MTLLTALVNLHYVLKFATFGYFKFMPFLTGVRDYIHVMDLASGHVAALAKVEKDNLRYRVNIFGCGSAFLKLNPGGRLVWFIEQLFY